MYTVTANSDLILDLEEHSFEQAWDLNRPTISSCHHLPPPYS